MKRIFSIVLIHAMLLGVMPVGVSAGSNDVTFSDNTMGENASALDISDNVIDIEDKTIYSYSRYYANVTNIKISGVNVERATQDGTTVDIVLDGVTSLDAQISVEFGTALNRCTISGHTGSVKLENGKAQLVMNIKGTLVSNMSGTVAYTLNFSLGEGPSTPPVCLKQCDSLTAYSGVSIQMKLSDYFDGARQFYLVEDETKT